MEALLIFIQGMLEATGVLAFNFALLRVKFDWKKIVITGGIFAVIITFFRALPIPFGVHTLVGFILFFTYIRKTSQKSILNILVTILSSAFTLAVLEMMINRIFIGIFDITSNNFIADKILWKMGGMPQGIILIILAVIISKILPPIEYEINI